MYELNQLMQLAAIADAGTVSAAAEKLNISQPALSRSVQKLEEELGVRLFDRSKNKITLNETGELAVEYARKIIFEAENMAEKVKLFDKSRRTISIGSCAPGPFLELSPLLSKLFDGISVSMEINEEDVLIKGLYDNIYNIIVLDKKIEAEDITVFKLCEEHLMLSVPPAHPLAMYKSIKLEDIDGETMLLYSHIGFWKRIQDTMTKTNFIEQDSREAFVELVKSAALPSFTSDLQIKHNGDVKNRVSIPIEDEIVNPRFYCHIHKKNKKALSPLIKKFV